MGVKRAGIYVIERIETGQKYVGQGLKIKKRMGQEHKACPAIFSAIKKYGKKAFKRYVVLYCEIEELDYYEIECIKIFHSHVSEGGYNISWGGETPARGWHHTPEAIEKLRIAMTGKNNPRFGVKLSPEEKKIIGESRIYPKGKDNPLFGIPKSPETKLKLSIANTGKIVPDDVRKKMSDSRKRDKNLLLGKKYDNSSSSYYGVYYVIRMNKYVYWQVYVTIREVWKYVGQYKTELEAAKAYDKYIAENNLNRPVNFPDGVRPYWEII